MDTDVDGRAVPAGMEELFPSPSWNKHVEFSKVMGFDLGRTELTTIVHFTHWTFQKLTDRKQIHTQMHVLNSIGRLIDRFSHSERSRKGAAYCEKEMVNDFGVHLLDLVRPADKLASKPPSPRLNPT